MSTLRLVQEDQETAPTWPLSLVLTPLIALSSSKLQSSLKTVHSGVFSLNDLAAGSKISTAHLPEQKLCTEVKTVEVKISGAVPHLLSATPAWWSPEDSPPHPEKMSRQASFFGTAGQSAPMPSCSACSCSLGASLGAELLPLPPFPPLPPLPPLPAEPILWALGGGSSNVLLSALNDCWK